MNKQVVGRVRISAWVVQVAASACLAVILFEAGRLYGQQAPANLPQALPMHPAAEAVTAPQGVIVAKAQGAAEPAAQLQDNYNFDIASYFRKHPAADTKWRPARRPGFKPPANAKQAVYDAMWTGSENTYKRGGCWGCRFAPDIVSKLQFNTVLDAGTGNGQMVRWLRMHGKAAFGVELSQAVLERDAPDLLEAGWVEQGSLTDLPYKDNQFDMVVSNDVLEHILPEQADDVVKELVRVAKRHIVVSISLKTHFNEQLHTLVRPRQWWEAKFEQHGARVNRPMVWALQQKEIRFSKDAGDVTSCRMDGDKNDGGKFEVCLIPLPWLVGIPGMELREHRTITTANAEVEPWFFAFTVGSE